MGTPPLSLAILAFFTCMAVHAQIQEPFAVRFNESLKGDVTIIGNNMLSRTATGNYDGPNDNGDFNDNVYVDIDNDNSTFNSSSANFSNPDPTVSCISVFKAYLYWAAADTEKANGDDNQPNWNFNDIKLMLPGEGAYSTLTADDVIYRGRDTHFDNDPYICVIDITAQVLALNDKYGTYQVANVEAAEGTLSHSAAGTSGGWQIVFVYGSEELTSKNVTLFDGYAHVSQQINNFDINFDGFETTPIGNVDANIVIGSLEGDRGLEGDRLQILDVAGNFIDIASPLRNADNFFNSRITLGNANYIDRNPASTNTLGYDAAVFKLDNPNNTIITNNQTNATIRLTSDQEVYGLFLLGLAVTVYQPNLGPLIVTQVSGTNPSNPGDVLGFNFNLENTGNDNAHNVTIATIIPLQLNLVPIVNLPTGVTYSYDMATGELIFSIENGLLNIGDPPISIDFELQVKEECFFLESNCDLSSDLQFTATYIGEDNTDEVITLSNADPNSCDFEPIVVDINQPVVNWLTPAGNLDTVLSCEDTAGLATAQGLEPEPDKCDFVLIKTSGQFVEGNCPNVGSYTNTWSFTDACGVTIADFVQIIQIIDDIAPTASNPPTINVQCIEDVPPPDPEVVIDEQDNCSVPMVAFVSDESNNEGCPKTITRTYSVTDSCENSIEVVQLIIVNDDVLPTASNLVTINVQCMEDIPPPDLEVVIDEQDNCSVPMVAFVSDESNNEGCSKTITRTYSVTDSCENSIEVVQLIIVNDDVLPTASNLATINVQCMEDIPPPDPEVVTDEQDNCSVPIVVFVSDESNNEGCPKTITRTYSVTDSCENSIEVVQLIIVNDDIAPTASNPPTINVQCMEDVPLPDPEVVTDEQDNCSVPIVVFVSDESNNEGCPKTITRTYSVTDSCENSIEVVQLIIVNDDVSPELVTAFEPEFHIACEEVPKAPILGFTDNCSADLTVDYNEERIDIDDFNFKIVRSWLVSDDCENQSEFTQTIFVETVFMEDFEQASLCIEDQSIDLISYVTNTPNLTGEWQSDDINLLVGTIFNPSNTPVGAYEFIYTYLEQECLWRTTIEIGVHADCVSSCIVSTEDVEISKLVTPNDDGQNDFFEVNYVLNDEGNLVCDISVGLEIYNRWGVRVYKEGNYENNWNGSVPSNALGNSDLLPSGTYYYIVRLTNGGLKPLQGYILLGTD